PPHFRSRGHIQCRHRLGQRALRTRRALGGSLLEPFAAPVGGDCAAGATRRGGQLRPGRRSPAGSRPRAPREARRTSSHGATAVPDVHTVEHLIEEPPPDEPGRRCSANSPESRPSFLIWASEMGSFDPIYWDPI
ncbi:unnamed protein product, partial [Prorocentrum cordatum]